MTQTVLLKRSAVAGRAPTTAQLALGEVGINTNDGRMFIVKNPGGVSSVVEIGSAVLTGDVTGTIAAQAGTLTLAASGITAGTYNGITFDAKGRATSASAVTSGTYTTTISAWTLVSGTLYSAVVTHNLGTQSIGVTLWDATTNQKLDADSVTASTTNTVTIVVDGNTTNVRCVVIANANSVVAANSVGVQDSGVAVGSGSFNTLNFAGSSLVVTDAGGGVALVSDTSPLRVFTYYPGAFNVPNSSDWAVNANAGVLADPNNVGINTQSFSNTVEQGVGFSVSVPVGATNVLFRVRGRAATAQGSVQVVQHKLYSRQIGTGAVMAAWSAASSLAPISIPTNAYYQTNAQTVTLASLGLAAGNMYQLEFTRAVTPSSGTQLAANWLLAEVTVEFS
jgi:hypothetical protein